MKVKMGEPIKGVIETVGEYVGNVQDEIDKMFENLRQVSVIEYSWEVLYKTAVSLESAFNEQVVGAVSDKVGDWENGKMSFVSFVERFKMGVMVEDAAKMQQQEIAERITSTRAASAISESKPNFLNTDINQDVVKVELEKMISQAQGLIQMTGDKGSRLSDLCEENDAVKPLVAAWRIYGARITDFAYKVIKRITAFLSGSITSMEQLNEVIAKEEERINEEEEWAAQEAAWEAEKRRRAARREKRAVEKDKQSTEEFGESIQDTLASMDKEFGNLFG